MGFFSVRIVARTLDDLWALDRLDLDLKKRAARQERSDRFVVPGVLTAEEIKEVEAAGYIVETISDLSRVADERSRDLSRRNRFVDVRGVSDFAERAVMGYMTAEEVESALINLKAANRDLITLIPLKHRTWEGRSSNAIRLRAGKRRIRPGVLFTGSMHAREWGGSDICVNFVVNLINSYRNSSALSYGGKTFSAAQVRTILERLDIFVFPDVNPDGKNYSQTRDVWWRKNRNPNTAVDPANPGVDLNRNFDFLWDSGIGTSTSPSSSVYRGAAPLSEPETQNVRDLLDTYGNICHFVDVHSYSELILYSWGDDDNQSGDPQQNFHNPSCDGKRGTPKDTLYREFISTLDENTLVNLANRMSDALTEVRGKEYTVQQAVGLYPTSGTSDDYALSRHFLNSLKTKVYAFTIEFATEFIPPFTEMSNVIKDVCSAMTELCWAVNSDVHVRHNPADTGEIPSRGPFWDSPDIWVRNHDDGGTVHQNTIRGTDNYVYVRVANRGSAEARNVRVRIYITSFAGTEFIHPSDWVPRNPSGGGTLTGPGTYLIGQFHVATLGPGASHTDRVKWVSSLIPPETNWHPCVLVEVSPNDRPCAAGDHVWQNNNLAQKNISIVTVRAGQILELPFRFGSRFSEAERGWLVVTRVAVPLRAGIFLDLKDEGLVQYVKELLSSSPRKRTLINGFGLATIDNRSLLRVTGLKRGKVQLPLKSGGAQPMALRIVIPEDVKPGERCEIQVVQYGDGKTVAGGLTLWIEVAG